MFWLRLRKLSEIILDPFLCASLLKGAAAGMEHRSVLQNLNCDYIVDVGANRGQFALIARKVFPKARIHSFEPLEEPIKIFKNIFRNDQSVTLYPYAIGRERTTTIIHVTRDDDSSSLLTVTSMQSSIFPGATEVEARQVAVFSLSQLLDAETIPPASLLKIDVQGFELDVIRGSEDIINKFSHLYIECSFVELYKDQALAHQIISWLEQRDFILSGVHNMYYERNGTAIQGDFLFTNRHYQVKVP
jgi:FkbM family methyltransferase